MDTIRALVRKHPVLYFYVIAFAFAWGGILAVIGGPGGIPGTPAQTDALIGPVMLFWLAGPSVAGVVITALVEGKAGLRALGSRLTKWRVGVVWYAAALLAAPLLHTLGLLLFSLFYPGYAPAIFTSSNKVYILLFGLVTGLVGGGFLEELGWTGFAIHNLRSRRGAIRTALTVGVLWGAAHFSFIFWMSGATIGDIPLAVFLIVRAIDLLLGGLLAFRVLMVWVYDRTGSLLIAMLMHGMLTACMFILVPEKISGVPFLVSQLLGSVSGWIIVAVVAGVYRLVHGSVAVSRDRRTVDA